MEEEKVPGQEPVWQQINAAQQKGPSSQAQVWSNYVCVSRGECFIPWLLSQWRGYDCACFLSVKLDLGIRIQRALGGEAWGKAEGMQMLEAGDGE